MKKLFFFCFVVFSTLFVANAQITIDQSDVATVKTVIHRGIDTVSTIIVTPAGPNQTWNYATAPQNKQDSIFFPQPDWTPYGSMNPTSNICMKHLPDTTYAYLISNASSITLIGQAASMKIDGNNITATAHLSNPATIMKFPATYQSNFRDTSAYFTQFFYGYNITIPSYGTYYVDSARARNTTVISDTIDAWGTITTPLGTFPSLREKRIEITNDSLWVHALLFPPSTYIWVDVTQYAGGKDTLLSYNWLADTMKFAVFQLDADFLTNTVTKAYFMNAQPAVGIVDIAVENLKCIIYPNPASDELSVYSNMPGNNMIEIFDNKGNLIRKITLMESDKKINISDLSVGLYFLRATNLKTKLSGSGKFSVVR